LISHIKLTSDVKALSLVSYSTVDSNFAVVKLY
jgi:hypothetical protein